MNTHSTQIPRRVIPCGRILGQHPQAGLARAPVSALSQAPTLQVKTHVKAGAIAANHNETLVRATSRVHAGSGRTCPRGVPGRVHGGAPGHPVVRRTHQAWRSHRASPARAHKAGAPVQRNLPGFWDSAKYRGSP
jgi:hypothetical protein